jgi:hypothetical protein
MGLDAVVYKSKAHLPSDPEIQDVQADPDTGQLYCSDEVERRYPRGIFKANGKRLGNSANISALRKEIELSTGAIPKILASRILYSATHSGDVIDVSDLDQLETEIQMVRLKAGEGSSSFLRYFLTDLTDLISSARHEHNPIVFV